MPIVAVDNFAKALGKELGEYFDSITEDVKTAVRETAEECVEEVKQKSPKRKGPSGGAYRKSWTMTEAYNRHGSIRFVVHNKKHYRLTHLLENGHAKKNGGRVDGIPHIAPAEKNAERNLIKRIEVAIKNDT